MRILITGGSGLIGQALTAQLLADKHDVIILTRNPQTAQVPSGAQAVQWDGRTGASWASYADGAAAIVNLAGENIAGDNPLTGRWTAARKKSILESRLNAGKAVVEAIRATKQRPGVLIQSSAVGYYGACGDEEVNEDHPAGQDFLSQVCVQWEKSTEAVDAMGVRRISLRTGLPLSKDGGALKPLLMIFKLFAGGPLGSGQQWFPWVHMADQVGAIRFAIEKRAITGALNVCSPNPLRNKDFSTVLGRVLGRPSFMPAPAFALRLAMGEMADALLLAGQRQLPRQLLKAGYQFKFPEAEAALRDTLKN